ncbi:MAG: ABC transporter ATP-binding protein [Acidobacteriota bacterium]
MSDSQEIVFSNVSKFYGEVLGVNRVDLKLAPGITGLVGPNGSGKTTLMNLMTGLLRPTRGSISILGVPPDRPELLFGRVGYCTQYDSFPKGLNGFQFIYSFLRIHGFPHPKAEDMTWKALEMVGLQDAARRKVAGYSKGMRQRIKLGQALAHQPDILVLDEPLNGLDPMARAEIIDLFKSLSERGQHVIVSSHILHELDVISDQVVMLSNGYIVAEGDIHGVREEMTDVPMQILVRCDKPAMLASRMFEEDHAVEAQMHDDGQGLLLRTRDADSFFLLMNRMVTQEGLRVESVAPADDDVHSIYQYLIGNQGGSSS